MERPQGVLAPLPQTVLVRWLDQPGVGAALKWADTGLLDGPQERHGALSRHAPSLGCRRGCGPFLAR